MKTRHSIKRSLNEKESDSESVPPSKKGRSSKKPLNNKETNSSEKKSVPINLPIKKKSKPPKKLSTHIEILSDSDNALDDKNSYFPITKSESKSSVKVTLNKQPISSVRDGLKSEDDIGKKFDKGKKKVSKISHINKKNLNINETESSYFVKPKKTLDNDQEKGNPDIERLSAFEESDQDSLSQSKRIDPKADTSVNKFRKSSRNSTKRSISYKEIDDDEDKEALSVKVKEKEYEAQPKQKSKKAKNVAQPKKSKTSNYFDANIGDKDLKKINNPTIIQSKKAVNKNNNSKPNDDVEEMSGSSESENDEWLEIPAGPSSPSKTTKEYELLLMNETGMKKESPSTSNSNKPYSIEITLLDPEMTKKCKTKSLEEVVKQKVRKVQRDTQEYLHKSHLLCIVAHGIYLNKLCSSNLYRGLALSSMTEDFIARINPITLEKVKLLLNWFKSNYSHYDEENCEPISKQMTTAFLNKTGNKTIIMLLMVVFMRTLSIEARVVLACSPLPLKLSQSAVIAKSKPTTSKKVAKEFLGTESDDDFDVVSKTEPDHNNKLTKNVLKKKNYSMLSDNEEISNTHPSLAYWIEFYLPKEKRWVCLEYFSSTLDDYNKVATKMKSALTHLTYVLAFNPKQSVKDISAKYDPERYTITRKFRVPSDWLDNALKLYTTVKTDITDRLEEEEIRRILMALPFPAKIDDFNNHPLYALTRFLKKYEVMYPTDPKSVGFIKNEPIYLRDNVHLCHTRETWLKSARVIRLGEQPIKKVRAQMSMKRKLLNEKDPVVELFGYWQTVPYDPPVAKGGKVPKNEHGNVDLYQECMLPVGCVYLQLPGLLRTAKKLNIDVAPAMIGWKFHARFARPILEGWVVCKEHAQTLQDAWAAEQDAKDKKRDEDRTSRALKNWRRLTRFLLIRHRIRSSYDMKCSTKESTISSVAQAMAQRLAGSSKTCRVPPQDE